jgi:hypothetical protein
MGFAVAATPTLMLVLPWKLGNDSESTKRLQPARGAFSK